MYVLNRRKQEYLEPSIKVIQPNHREFKEHAS